MAWPFDRHTQRVCREVPDAIILSSGSFSVDSLADSNTLLIVLNTLLIVLNMILIVVKPLYLILVLLLLIFFVFTASALRTPTSTSSENDFARQHPTPNTRAGHKAGHEAGHKAVHKAGHKACHKADNMFFCNFRRARQQVMFCF